MGTLFVFYDLSQRFTLRGQSGKESAVDLIFTLRYN
jgi:translocation and assembly module TamB